MSGFCEKCEKCAFFVLGVEFAEKTGVLRVKIRNFLDKTDCIMNSKYGLKECVSFVIIWKKSGPKVV